MKTEELGSGSDSGLLCVAVMNAAGTGWRRKAGSAEFVVAVAGGCWLVAAVLVVAG